MMSKQTWIATFAVFASFSGLFVVTGAAREITGSTVGLKGEKLSGVTVSAIRVTDEGQLRGQIGEPVLSDGSGEYTIEVFDEPRVVLRFFRSDRSEVFVPQRPNGNSGGALFFASNDPDLSGMNVAVPDKKFTPRKCPPPCYRVRRRCRFRCISTNTSDFPGCQDDLDQFGWSRVESPFRVWTDVTGKRTAVAAFSRAQGGIAYFVREDGRSVETPLHNLCDRDREMIAKGAATISKMPVVDYRL